MCFRSLIFDTSMAEFKLAQPRIFLEIKRQTVMIMIGDKLSRIYICITKKFLDNPPLIQHIVSVNNKIKPRSNRVKAEIA